MIKKSCGYLLRTFLIIAVVFSYFVTPEIANAAAAETLGDLRNEYNELLKKKQENDNKTDAAKAEIARKEAAIKQAQADITEAEHQYDEAEQSIVESNEKIDSLTEETKKVLLYMQQMQGQNAYVEYVSGASSMTELIMRVEAVNQVSGYIQKTTKNLESEIKRNEELKTELTEKQKKLENQIASYEKTIEEQYDSIDEYDIYALDINQQVEIAKDKYDHYYKACKTYAGTTDDSTPLSSCVDSDDIPYNSGWLKPLKSGVVTSKMGYRTHPVTGQKYKFHDAIDIGGNSEGTKVYAAAAGIVSGIARKTSCGGNKVYVDVTVGGKKYTTYYYHLLAINVKVGDIVNQNTVIGTVGGYSTSTSHGGYDACTTGAHLHYGVATGWFNGRNIPTSTVITPPGFNNSVGYRFYSRTDYYGN
ncbi:putative uncharacterized protein [Mycoplasma sp. CAG:776]|nr:putative uncharacterized protein [Mycoplasma sp. CAG:776]